MIGTSPLDTHDTHVGYSICNRNENQEFGSNPGSFGAQRSQVNAVMGPGSLLVGLFMAIYTMALTYRCLWFTHDTYIVITSSK